jgi:hypothetical protein
MTNLEVVTSCLLIASLGANALLGIKLKTRKAPSEMTYDASQLLRDLLAGKALVKVERIAPEGLFIMAPRDRG